MLNTDSNSKIINVFMYKFWSDFSESKVAVISLLILIAIVLIAIFAPLI